MSDLDYILERNKRRAEKRAERAKREGVNCNLCCSDPETGTPGCVEDSCKVMCEKCPKCPSDNKTKVAPKDGSPETHEMQRGGRKTKRKRRKKRRKSRKMRKKTKRRRKRTRKTRKRRKHRR